MIRVSVATLRNWAQGRRMPDGPALALLRPPEAARHPKRCDAASGQEAAAALVLSDCSGLCVASVMKPCSFSSDERARHRTCKPCSARPRHRSAVLRPVGGNERTHPMAWCPEGRLLTFQAGRWPKMGGATAIGNGGDWRPVHFHHPHLARGQVAAGNQCAWIGTSSCVCCPLTCRSSPASVVGSTCIVTPSRN